jgi:hypothetical protein
MRIRVQRRLPGVLGAAKTGVHLHHALYRHPGLQHEFQEHQGGRQHVSVEYGVGDSQIAWIERHGGVPVIGLTKKLTQLK